MTTKYTLSSVSTWLINLQDNEKTCMCHGNFLGCNRRPFSLARASDVTWSS